MGLETRCEANVVEKAALVLVQPLLGKGLELNDCKVYYNAGNEFYNV